MSETLYSTIEQHLKDAMRAQAKDRLMALRNIKAVLKNRAIDLRRDLKDEEVIQSLSTLAKQRKESIESFQAAGRQDLVDKENAELQVIEEFLPQALSPEELDRLISDTLREVSAADMRDLGRVMKALVPKTVGRADGKQLSERVKVLLGAETSAKNSS